MARKKTRTESGRRAIGRRGARTRRAPGPTAARGLTRSPAEPFIRYHLLRNRGSRPAAVVAELRGQGVILPANAEAYVEELAAGLERPLASLLGGDLLLRRQWLPDAAVIEARRIRGTPALRDRVDALLAAGFGADDVGRLLLSAGEREVGADGVRTYESLFWNMGLLALAERAAPYADPHCPEGVRRAHAACLRPGGRSEVLGLLGLERTTAGRIVALEDRLWMSHARLGEVDGVSDVLEQSQALLGATQAMIRDGRRLDALLLQERAEAAAGGRR